MSNARPLPEPHQPRLDDEMLTMKEVAALLRVPEATLRYWRHLGTGPRGFRLGRSVRYWRTEVWAWLATQTREGRGDRSAP